MGGNRRSFIVSPTDRHDLSWWDDGWWCTCGRVDPRSSDFNARHHYDAVQTEAGLQLARERQTLIEERGKLRY